MGGAHFRTDEGFVSGAVADVEKLQRTVGLSPDSRVLDWGCGAGRLNVGIKHVFGHVRDYHGIDVQKPLVRWARRHLADDHSRFALAEDHNARYNPDGVATHRLARRSDNVDVFHAYSVFSHMGTADVAGYSRDIARVLAPQGLAWVTAFVEDDVPHETENPAGYGDLDWSGPLHCVLFNRSFLEGVFAGAGLEVVGFEHGQETDGQSAYVLRAR